MASRQADSNEIVEKPETDDPGEASGGNWFERLRRNFAGGGESGNSERGKGKGRGEAVAQPEEMDVRPRTGDSTPAESTDLVAEQELQDERAAEARLVEQAKQDPQAFGVLYERYVDRIYSYIYHRVGSAQDAEDLTARTFYRALDKLDTYEDRGLPFSAWLFRIAHNLMANWHRDRNRRSFLSLDRLWFYGNSRHSPEALVEEDEKHEALWSAIERLPEDRKNLLLWKFGSQLSNLEIGNLMDKSESAIKSLYFRTLAALREDLEKRGWGIDMMRRPEIVDDPVAEPTLGGGSLSSGRSYSSDSTAADSPVSEGGSGGGGSS